MHHAFAPRRCGPLLATLAAAASLGLPAARGDLVYVLSKTTGGLYSFDSGNPSAITSVVAPGTFNQPTALALGDDGNLYVGESPDAVDGDPRILRYVIGSGSISEVVNLSGTAAGYSGPAVYPGAIAFRRVGDGGEMLVGRNPDSANPYGPVMAVSGWKTIAPSVAAFTSGTLNASPGLAVSPETGNLFVSNDTYGGTNAPILGTIAVFSGTSNPATFIGSYTTVGAQSGPIGLVVSGSTLYSANAVTNQIMATDLLGSGSSGQVVAVPLFAGQYPYEVGALTRLSDGDLLTGSLLAFSGQMYRISVANGTATPLYTPGSSGFGQIAGIVTMVVPEPTTLAIAVSGLAVAAAWRRRRRRTVA